MSDKILHTIAQYTRHLLARAHVRPYQNTGALRNDLSGNLTIENLPEADHYRVELELTIQALNEASEACFDASCRIEAIVLAKGFAPEELRDALTLNIGGMLAGHIRAAIATASLGTGYGPVTLPPFTSQQLAALVAPSE